MSWQRLKNLPGGSNPQPLSVVIGHRGLAARFPENTLVSFAAALQAGASMIELDLRLSADGQAVVIHDATVDRTTNGTGLIKSINLKDLQKLDAGYHFSTDGKTSPFRSCGLTVPTLQQVFEAFPQAHIAVELKDDSTALIAEVYRLVKQFGRFDRTLIQVFSIKSKLGKSLRKLDERLITGHTTSEMVLFGTLSRMRLSALWRRRSLILDVPVKRGRLPVVTGSFVKAAHRRGLIVLAWTVNEAKELERLYKLGVDGVYTDDVAAAHTIIEQLRRRYSDGAAR